MSSLFPLFRLFFLWRTRKGAGFCGFRAAVPLFPVAARIRRGRARWRWPHARCARGTREHNAFSLGNTGGWAVLRLFPAWNSWNRGNWGCELFPVSGNARRMANASTSCGNKIWGGYRAAPVFIPCGGAVRPEIRADLVPILLPAVAQLRWSGGASVPPAKTADFCGSRRARSGVVETACRNTGRKGADFCGFQGHLPLMNNQRHIARPRSICAPAGPDRAAGERRGVSPLFARARSPHAGRARVTTDFRAIARPLAGCMTSAEVSEGAETGIFGPGSGVRGRSALRKSTQKARISGREDRFEGNLGSANARLPVDPVAVAEAAPRRG